jgi:alpha/beta superfamily hydrolase
VSERLTLETSDGETLEARWDLADGAIGAVVFCHPHPMQGGSMMAPLMIAVTTRLVERGFSVLRFNFRGTGNSSGAHDQGVGEKLDIDAAVAEAESAGAPIRLGGWSFGAGVGLNWIGERGIPLPFSGIAPSAKALPQTLPPGPKRIVIGTRDQVVDVDLVRSYAEANQIDLVLTPGDHFFHGRGKKVGDLVAQGFE